MKNLTVEAGDQRYDVLVGRLEDCRSRLVALAAGRPLVAVTEPKVWSLHGPRLQAMLPCDPVMVPEGEEAKDWPHLMELISAFTERNLDRSAAIAAFGGGSVGDLAGLAAGLFKRGLPIVQLPTTLLAQADSAVGGKTAIDALGQKNLVGMFHQPRLVIADVSLLDSLDKRQLRGGYAEVVKYGLIRHETLFEWLEGHGPALLDGHREYREEAVWQSVAAKARTVEADVTDRNGARALLNFGHTFGHALESAAGLGTLLHGEAVGIGMVLAFDLSAALGLCAHDDATRVRAHLQSVGLPVTIAETGVDRAALLPLMRADKKNEGGAVRLVLSRGIGHAFLSEGVAEDVLAEFLATAA
ncbi:3-dehydroquinate synthase [Sphingomonas glaciei]|uniref:3-dehydroquinate synthase n=1 Tax=Sphingomonas glaciei TaxID=2938948 RepID=A0ABY5MWU1_9SPHN|nr:3-dehydroquinate synthase [Sphingomonas glaciei]UUR08276.1 3-dehydroquinate synthase [Sphingomonas glaciei]